jgi:beta-mannosidase
MQGDALSHTAMKLDGIWELAYGPQTADAPETPEALRRAGWPTIPATVPGNVELDLLAAGRIAEPSVGNNIYDLVKYEDQRWFYRRRFASPAVRDSQRVVLRFDGLDCLGTIFLNGRQVGTTDNMFIPHEFDVTALLATSGENELVVRIDSAVLAGRKHQPAPGELAHSVNWESLPIRKAPHMYGWDIMPRLVSAGLWRDVSLRVQEATHWRSVYWTTLAADPAKRTATVMVDWDFATDRADVQPLRVFVTVGRDGQAVHRSEHAVLGTHGRARISLENVDLWWPRGYGAPNLYDAVVVLADADDAVLDRHTCRIGLRTVQLRRTDITTPEHPGEFLFVVNGEPIFVKGTNWVPLDGFHSRDPQHLSAAFAMLVDLNCNMVRCWGGNVYESQAFFNLCDRHGVMVWQDFAMACWIYPQSDAFAGQIRREAEAIVPLLRNHPSLALWSGNNEIDESHEWAGLGVDPNTDRLSREVLPAVVRRLDPVRPYLPSSPYRSPAFVTAGGHHHLKPEDHLWGPRDDFKGRYYTSSPAHFASEIGYHGCPDRASLEQMMEPGHVWPWQDNEQWLTHCVRPLPGFTLYNYRIPLMANQIAVLFGEVPDDLDQFILASQASQAEALKFFIERFRQDKFRRTGILWWNLRDGWPEISDAIVDYYGRRKLAYHYVRRIQADVCPICAEAVDGRHRFVVVNDTLAAVAGRLCVTASESGRVLLEQDVSIAANGKAVVGAVPEAAEPTLWLLRFAFGENVATNHYISGPRPYRLTDYSRWAQRLGAPGAIAFLQSHVGPSLAEGRPRERHADKRRPYGKRHAKAADPSARAFVPPEASGAIA